MADWANPNPYWLRGPQGIQAYLAGSEAARIQADTERTRTLTPLQAQEAQNHIRLQGLDIAHQYTQNAIQALTLEQQRDLVPVQTRATMEAIQTQRRITEDNIQDNVEALKAQSDPTYVPQWRRIENSQKWQQYQLNNQRIKAQTKALEIGVSNTDSFMDQLGQLPEEDQSAIMAMPSLTSGRPSPQQWSAIRAAQTRLGIQQSGVVPSAVEVPVGGSSGTKLIKTTDNKGNVRWMMPRADVSGAEQRLELADLLQANRAQYSSDLKDAGGDPTAKQKAWKDYLDRKREIMQKFRENPTPANGETEVNVISPDGTQGTIPESEVEEALKQGYRLAE